MLWHRCPVTSQPDVNKSFMDAACHHVCSETTLNLLYIYCCLAVIPGTPWLLRVLRLATIAAPTQRHCAESVKSGKTKAWHAKQRLIPERKSSHCLGSPRTRCVSKVQPQPAPGGEPTTPSSSELESGPNCGQKRNSRTNSGTAAVWTTAPRVLIRHSYQACMAFPLVCRQPERSRQKRG